MEEREMARWIQCTLKTQQKPATNHLLQHNFYSFWLILIIRTLFVILFRAATIQMIPTKN